MNIPELHATQTAFFHTHVTKGVSWRIDQLKKLRAAMLEFEPRIKAALKADLNKSESESYLCELGLTLMELNECIKKLTSWAKPRRVWTPMSQFPGCSWTQPEPLGLTLIISPWNYPFMLCLTPLIASIAAGNCCILKPSEMAPATSALLSELIQQVFEEKHVAVVEGGIETNTELLEQKFDHIFYTGNSRVGEIVMRAASRHLTPVTLELGGKSPCIVDASADIEVSARRIAFGKVLNAGQTCVAPDYLLLHRSIKNEFIAAFKKALCEMLGDSPLTNVDYPRIINEKHFERLNLLLKGQTILHGGASDASNLSIEPTLVDIKSTDCALMAEEIFGPILPVICFDVISEVEAFILARPKPLACYIFTRKKAVQKQLLRNLSFGGGCINDCLMHLAVSGLPFGGVGNSGMGAYHGKKSFETFSHYKSVHKKALFLDLPFRYQPYSRLKDKILRFFLK